MCDDDDYFKHIPWKQDNDKKHINDNQHHRNIFKRWEILMIIKLWRTP